MPRPGNPSLLDSHRRLLLLLPFNLLSSVLLSILHPSFRHQFQFAMSEQHPSVWVRSLSPHLLAVVSANPIDQITAKFIQSFKLRWPNQNLDNLSLFEKFTALVTKDSGIIVSSSL